MRELREERDRFDKELESDTSKKLAFTVLIEDSIRIQTRSIMGTEIPHVKYDARQVKDLTIKLAEVDVMLAERIVEYWVEIL